MQNINHEQNIKILNKVRLRFFLLPQALIWFSMGLLLWILLFKMLIFYLPCISFIKVFKILH